MIHIDSFLYEIALLFFLLLSPRFTNIIHYIVQITELAIQDAKKTEKQIVSTSGISIIQEVRDNKNQNDVMNESKLALIKENEDMKLRLIHLEKSISSIHDRMDEILKISRAGLPQSANH